MKMIYNIRMLAEAGGTGQIEIVGAGGNGQKFSGSGSKKTLLGILLTVSNLEQQVDLSA